MTALGFACPAAAQDADPIGALLTDPQAPASAVIAAPAPAAAPAPVSPAQPPPAAAPTTQGEPPVMAGSPPLSPAPPAAPASPYRPAPFPYGAGPPPARTYAQPSLTEPVQIDEVGRTPESPFAPRDPSYDSRLRSSFASAQGMQGPLDGGWTLSATGGGDLYSFQLVDRSDGYLEGAWRDLRRTGALAGSGFVDVIQRYGSQLTLRFQPSTGGGMVTASLMAGGDGRWAGELTGGGESRAVVLRRN